MLTSSLLKTKKIKMKTILTCVLLFIGFALHGQTTERVLLLKGYSEEELKKVEKEDAKMYTVLKYGISKGWNFVEASAGKKNNFPTLKLTVAQMENFNYLSHGIKIQQENQYFAIENTNKILVIQGIMPIIYTLKLN
jgi:hypothetical protein